jgi:hypothetical protein
MADDIRHSGLRRAVGSLSLGVLLTATGLALADTGIACYCNHFDSACYGHLQQGTSPGTVCEVEVAGSAQMWQVIATNNMGQHGVSASAFGTCNYQSGVVTSTVPYVCTGNGVGLTKSIQSSTASGEACQFACTIPD